MRRRRKRRRRRTKEFPESTVTGQETWVDHCTPQTTQSWNAMEIPNFSDSQKIQSVSVVCWKSYGLCILGYRKSHPC
jgi:hypothetical protein